jgi:anthranilate phosphoribosyltransferase
MSAALRAAIAKVAQRRDLGEDEVAAAFGAIMDGEATAAQIGGLVMALRVKGETAEEIAGAARAMRARMTRLEHPRAAAAVDTCGTGGDGAGTVNVSTLAAIMVAAVGVPVAKHGNRALSSRSGSADVLEALGVAVEAPAHVLGRCLDGAGICFLFAPAFHAATRHATGPRKELGTRTIFNLLGPMTNPAGVTRQVIGVFDGRFCTPVARALGRLGAQHVMVVHGQGGLDEIAVDGPTQVAEWRDGVLREHLIEPSNFGLELADAAGLAGGDAATNAEILRAALAGQASAVRTAALLAAAATLYVAGAAHTLADGAALAARGIDDGRAAQTLASWAALSNRR